MANKEGNFNPLNMSELTRDAFRSLRMNISFSGGDEDIKTLVVTSAVPSEGKTSVSVGLGVSMAESMKNTLIIECDCRRPAVGNRLKIRPEKNWIDVLYQSAELRDAVVQTGCPNLFFLDAEPGLVHSVELLNSKRFHDMVDRLKKEFDFIIFDTPPLGSFIDAAVLAEYADGAIVVISSGSREIRLIQQTVEQLKKANARILGVVLNKVNAHKNRYYQYGDYYYREHERDQRARAKTEKTSRAKTAPRSAKKEHARKDDSIEAALARKNGRVAAADRTASAKLEQNEMADIPWDAYLQKRQPGAREEDDAGRAAYRPADESSRREKADR